MNKEDIVQWLEERGITGYTIHPNLVVDVNDHVNLSNQQLVFLPFQFGTISGDFAINDNTLLTLKNCPTAVGENFWCDNNRLTSLKHGPTTVGGYLNCSNNLLTTLEHCPTTSGEYFGCSDNPFELNVENVPEWISAIGCSASVYCWIPDASRFPKLSQIHKMLYDL